MFRSHPRCNPTKTNPASNPPLPPHTTTTPPPHHHHNNSYASFLKLLEKHPDKLTALRLSGPTLTFLYAGQKVLTRIVQTDGFLMSKLITSGVDFASVPPQLNVLGLVSTCLYLLFLLMINSRMMNGPQDEGAGKRRDKNNNFGSLSFAEVAGQERAMGEVRESCCL